MSTTVWLSQHIDTANSRTLRSCENDEEFMVAAQRWLAANGGLVDYNKPSTGERAVYSLQDIIERM